MGQITKQIKGKIIFKHETEADWKSSSYVPDEGEQVIYDPDGSHPNPRIKIGDGKRVVDKLPFATVENPTKISAFENDVEYITAAHNVDSYAHTDIREQINQLSSEIVDEVQAREQDIIDVKAQIIQQIPLFANSIEECTDTSKVYVLPDGYIYAYVKTVEEGTKIPNFENLMDDPNAYIKKQHRYSHSGKAFTTNNATCAIVVPIREQSTKYFIRIMGATPEGANYANSIYFGTDNTSFQITTGNVTIGTNLFLNTDTSVDGSLDMRAVPSTAHSYIVFHVADSNKIVDKSSLIVTINEEISYTEVEGGAVYEWKSTGHAFIPADYEDRIIGIENNVEEQNEELNRLDKELDIATSTMFISPEGDDDNDGLTDSKPKKTVKACVLAGAKRISAKRGTYNEEVALSNIDTLEIFPTDNNYTNKDVHRYPPIIFDTSDTIAISNLVNYNSIKSVAYAKQNAALEYVFTNGFYDTVYSTIHGYHVVLWLITDNIKNDIKLRPVATIAEVESNNNTFTWSNSTLYLNANLTDVKEIRVPTSYNNTFTISTANKVKLTEVEINFAGRYNLFIENCPDVEINNCSVKYSSNGSGFDLKSANGILRNCYASRVHDGYGIGGCGHTVFIDCTAEWCFDDGMSHHTKCTGTVIGGRFEGNRKGGNVPAYGANVNIYGGLYKDNQMYGIAYITDSTHNPSTGLIHGAVITGNDKGLLVDSNCEVTAVNCDCIDNVTDKEATGILTEISGADQSSGHAFEFVESTSEFEDTKKLYVLPDGSIYKYEAVASEELVPAFTNLVKDSRTIIKEGYRYSYSAGNFVECPSDCAIIVPITGSAPFTFRTRGGSYAQCEYPNSLYFGTTSDSFAGAPSGDASNLTYGTDTNGDTYATVKSVPSGNWKFAVFNISSGIDVSSLIVTVNEEIKYVIGKDFTKYEWQKSDYGFVTKQLSQDLAKLKEEVATLIDEGSSSGSSIEFVESVDDFVDSNKLYVLPDGSIYEFKYATVDVVTPNFTNLMKSPDAYIKNGFRYSLSTGAFVSSTNDCAVVIPFTGAAPFTVRTRGGSYANVGHANSAYLGTSNTAFTGAPDGGSANLTYGTDANGDTYLTVQNIPSGDWKFLVFHIQPGVDASTFIVTLNEEIKYTTVKDYTDYQWVKSDYSLLTNDRVKELNSQLEALKAKGGTTAFSLPAYCPTPQLPADGSEGSDFNYKTLSTQDAYDYMDALCNQYKYKGYITKQSMGKDASNSFDHNRYILSKAYWRAWQKANYPKMFAWKKGTTVIYSVSVSPRIGDYMYSTKFVGTVYGTVEAVNVTAGVLSTRTVKGSVFTRDEASDIEPILVYTKPLQSPRTPNTITPNPKFPVYDANFDELTQLPGPCLDSYITIDGVQYDRYPFGDRKLDQTKPLSIFILSNEHGLNGDALIPSMVVMRMAKDLCKNTDNPFLKWLKENCMITMIPVGNPWGYGRYLNQNQSERSGYYNSNGININRNYDTPGWAISDTNYGDTSTFGTYPGCEIETQHIMNTMRLCNPNVGISMHGLGYPPEYRDILDNGYFIYQGQGFDSSRMKKIIETLYSSYHLGGGASVDYGQHYNSCGKSPAYIQYCGAVGGLTETICWECGTENEYTSTTMEQAYTQLLLFLQTWCEEYLEKIK